jgi:hypothetical protein
MGDPAGTGTPAGIVARGVVRDTAGSPLGGAVWAVLDAGGAQVDHGRTDGSGNFAFADAGLLGTPPAEVVLVVRHPGHRPRALTVALPTTIAAGPAWVEVVLRRGLRVSGVVRSSSGEVVPGARVRLTDAGGALLAEASTDATGRYELLDVAAGSCTLTALGSPSYGARVTIAGGRDVEAVLSVANLGHSS